MIYRTHKNKQIQHHNQNCSWDRHNSNNKYINNNNDDEDENDDNENDDDDDDDVDNNNNDDDNNNNWVPLKGEDIFLQIPRRGKQSRCTTVFQ